MPDTPVLQRIPLKQIRPDPTQSRTDFDEGYIRELADSIQEVGLLQPVSVRQAGKNFELIAGECRFRAVSLLNKEAIDAFVYPEDTPAQETEYMSLVENIQRKDLNPIEEAKGYFRLTEPPYDQNNRQISKKVGKAEDVVSRALALLDLPLVIQESLARAKLLPGQVRYLAKITNAERLITLAKQAETEDWSVKETEKRVNLELAGKGKTPKIQLPNVPEDDVQQTLGILSSLTPDLDHSDLWEVHYAGKRKLVIELSLEADQPMITKFKRWVMSVAQELGAKDIQPQPIPNAAPPKEYAERLKKVTKRKMPDFADPETIYQFMRDKSKTEAQKQALMKKWEAKYKK